MSGTRRDFLRGVFATAAVAAAGPALANNAPRDRFTGYREILETAHGMGSQFLLMYDTHHQNRGMATYPLEREALDAAQSRGFKNIFMEFPRELQSVIDDRASGLLSHSGFARELDAHGWTMLVVKDRADLRRRDVVVEEIGDVIIVNDVEGKRDYVNRLSRGIVEAKARGIRVVGADSADYTDENRMRRDPDVADYIARIANGQPSVVSYGVLHGSVNRPGILNGGGLDDELRRHGSVITVEMQDAPVRRDGTQTAEIMTGVRDYMVSIMGDRSSNRLDIETGVLTRLPSSVPEPEEQIIARTTTARNPVRKY